MPQHTPAQIKAIQAWTEERDSLLRDIGIYSVELEALKKDTKGEGLALADLHRSISEARGRLAELDALEARYRNSLSTDIATLEVRKSRLEGECVLLEEKLKGGNEKYEIVTAATAVLEAAHDVMKDQSAIVNRVVGEIITTSQTHTSEMGTIMAEIRTIATEVIEKGNTNVAQTNIILEKLPKYIFELQKPIPVRRTYPAGHPNAGISIREEIKP